MQKTYVKMDKMKLNHLKHHQENFMRHSNLAPKFCAGLSVCVYACACVYTHTNAQSVSFYEDMYLKIKHKLSNLVQDKKFVSCTVTGY